jgi:hypothetical protein
MEEEKLYGKLFGTIPVFNDDHMDMLLNTMDKNNAIFYLTQAVKLAYESQLYSLGESEVLSRSIRLLSKPEEDETKKDEI